MTTEPSPARLGISGARAWADFQEPHFRPLYDAVHQRLGIASRTRLLDVGCGPGGAALLASQRGAQVAGLDASPESIEVARERIPDGDFRVGDMERLPWSDASFDAVTGFNSFQFARNRAAALAEVRRVLAPGCKVGLAVWAPPHESQQPRIMAAISALAPSQPPDAPGPFALSAAGVVQSVLQTSGLRPVDEGEIPIRVEYPDAETAFRAMVAGSAGVRAVQNSGEERVRQIIYEALDQFRIEAGGFRMENLFRFIIAEPESTCARHHAACSD